MEYARFGNGIVQRQDTDHEWEPVPPDDIEEATAQVERQESLIPPEGSTPFARIIRSDRNREIAARLGLNADELAERLAEPDQNEGTRTRVSEEEFDSLMGELGLSPEEARARFKGTHAG